MRSKRLIALAAVGLAALFGGREVPASAADSCPNAAFRTGPGAELAECRAYEMVSPPDKGGYDVRRKQTTARSSTDGNAITYDTIGTFPEGDAVGSQIYPRYLTKRTATGWVGTSIDSPMDSQIFTGGFNWYLEQSDPGFFTPNLSATGYLNYGGEMLPEATPGAVMLYRRDLNSGQYQLLTRSENEPIPPTLFTFDFPNWVTSTADNGKILFEAASNLTGNASGPAPKLYEWDHGTLRLAGILPNGEPAPEGSVAGGDLGVGSAMNQTQIRGDATLSADGSHVIFSTLPIATRQLYLRSDNGTPGAKTVRISESEVTPPDPTSLPAEFVGATEDGNRILFISGEKLTDEGQGPSSEEPASRNLYLFTNGPNPEGEGNLKLISRDAEPSDGEAAHALGLLAISSDASRIYFAADGQIVPGAPTGLGPKIYLWENGSIRYLATVGTASNNSDSDDWDTSWNEALRATRVTADGRFLLFRSASQLTSYDNNQLDELYLYDAASGQLSCASCNPSGQPATAPAVTGGQQPTIKYTRYEPRLMVDLGGHAKVFFGSREPLTAGDVNGRYDVYGYDSADGSVVRYSSGTSPADSFFMDASPDGRDVFFVTRSRLSGWDRDELMDLYDARAGGGLPGPPSVQLPCSGEACQGGGPEAPAAPAIGSAQFDAPMSAKKPAAKPKSARKCNAKTRKKGCAKKGHSKRDGGKKKSNGRKGGQNGRAGR